MWQEVARCSRSMVGLAFHPCQISSGLRHTGLAFTLSKPAPEGGQHPEGGA